MREALGDLETELGRVDRALRDDVADLVDEVFSLELADREVHRDREGRADDRTPLHRLASRLFKHKAAERENEPGLFGESDERVRAEQAPITVIPPHKRLGTDDPTGLRARTLVGSRR